MIISNFLAYLREGILLFDLTNKNVWKKAVDDSLGLAEFFANNLDNYTWEERIDASVYKCIDLKTAKKVKNLIYKLNRGNIDNEKILNKINEESALSLEISSKNYVMGENKFIDSIEWKKGISKDIKTDKGEYIIINVKNILPSGQMQLSEVKGKVISDYQKFLDTEWITFLRDKYKYSVNKDLLYSLIK